MLYCIFNVICKENNAVDTEYFNIYHQIKYLLCKDLIRIEWRSSQLQIRRLLKKIIVIFSFKLYVVGTQRSILEKCLIEYLQHMFSVGDNIDIKKKSFFFHDLEAQYVCENNNK